MSADPQTRWIKAVTEGETTASLADWLAEHGPKSVAVRYLLIELPINDDKCVAEDSTDRIRGDLGDFLQDEGALADLATITQVYPGDVVAQDVVDAVREGNLMGHTAVVTVTQAPGDEGAAYTLTLHDGQQAVIGDTHDDYGTLAEIIDTAFGH